MAPLGEDPLNLVPDDLTEDLLAIRNFTDREEAIAAFNRHLNAAEGAALPVLHFYGVGGIGKSLLLRKLRDELPPGLPHARVDFEFAGMRDELRALTLLRVNLGQEFDLAFYEFDLVRTVLAAKEGAGEEELVAVSPFLRAFLSGLKAVPGVGEPLAAGTEAVEHVLHGLQSKFPKLEGAIRWFCGTQGVMELRRLDVGDLLNRLVRAFAAGLSDGAPEREGHACRAVIFLDSYERLWEATPGPTDAQVAGRDEWVRDLYSYLCHSGRVLMVIAGRDYLPWRRVDHRWAKLDEDELDDCLDAHLIGGLSAEDTQRYLAKCGVGHPPEAGRPTPLQAAIIECSEEERGGCLPFYVGLCANIVLEHRAEEMVDPPADWFAGIPRDDVAGKLAGRFLTSVGDPVLSEMLMDLSLARWFDLVLVKAKLEVGEPQARVAFKRLSEFSFTQEVTPGRLRLHSIMAEALEFLLRRAKDGPDRLRAAHEWFKGHWQSRFEAGEAEAEVEAWYHWLRVDPQAAVEAWGGEAEKAVKGLGAARGRTLIGWWDGIDLTTVEWRKGMGDEPWASALCSLAYWLDELRPFAARHEAVLGRVVDSYEAALRVRTEAAFPTEWGMTQNNLGAAYRNLPTGGMGENLRRAIACYEAALRVWTEEAFPAEWAMTQNNLGLAYGSLPTGDRAENLRRAIECCEAALRVYTEEAFPADWAMAQNNLGIAHLELPTGQRANNLARAIACYEAALRVYTEEAFPADWARTQNNLGIAYGNLPTGDRAENLARAIDCFGAGLRVYTDETFPSDWAMTQINLGNAYSRLPAGDRAKNLARALACYEAALRVWTEESFPYEWATTQNNLGNAYGDLPTGDRGNNLRRAIECYQAALRVRTEDAFPDDWAGTQNNLGIAYRSLPTGDWALDLARAIECYEAALRVRTEEAFPEDWAKTQSNLGAALLDLPTGDRGENLRRAIECYEAALRVYTEKEFPVDWAMTQNNLGVAYESLPNVDREKELTRAIECYEAALRVRTEEAFPEKWAATVENLAIALSAAGEYGRAVDLFEQVVAAQPENDRATYNLACVLALSGESGRALEELERAIALDPKWREYAREDEDFASLREDERFQKLAAGD